MISSSLRTESMQETDGSIKKELEELFAQHATDRVCVLGTICCGKTTLLRQITNCVDVDDELWSRLTEEETAFVSRTPWTEEIGDEIDRLVKERITIRPGFPHFGTVILDCEVIVYLDIDDSLLRKRCKKRGTSFTDAIRIKESIENDLESYKRTHSDKAYYYFRLKE